MNPCVLGPSYETEPDEEQAAREEIRCDKENADAARYCAKLHEKCAEALSSKR